MKLLTPLFLIVFAGAILYFFTYPWYQEIQVLRAEIVENQDSLDRAERAKTSLAQKRTLYDTFSDEDKAKLETFLPDKVDDVRWIVDLTSITRRNNATLSDIRVSEDSRGSTESPVGVVTATYKVSLPYASFLKYLADLQKSLKFTDISSVDFASSVTGTTYDYIVNLKTYWLK
ncbi:hypothetical protein KW782_00565 [Candidatus Parcubacteria bacterium]|nr:hypothetical protein [Candidatus Parcubacteria bacterium]